jgi:aminoglycoside phosphotransferase (APT) family kinase protein
MAGQDMPAAEVEVDAGLVRRLLASQYPDLAGVPVVVLANGWDNFSFRAGEDHVIRLPRREASVALIDHEMAWLPLLAPMLPLPIPTPLFRGEPGEGYPWPWLIAPHLEGESAALVGGLDHPEVARQLGSFLSALHRVAPREAPSNPYRGVPLAARDAATRERLDLLADSVDVAALTQIWDRALETGRPEGDARWLHGDLHPHNLLAKDGRLTGVVDFGDITSGDPATDLAVAWMMFGSTTRADLVDAYGNDDAALWARAFGWALSLGSAFLAHSADNPVMREIGARTLAEVLEETGL